MTKRIYLGGSDRLRVLSWNVRTGNEKYCPIKSELMKRSGANVLCLNETRREMKMRGFLSFLAVPSLQANGKPKINSEILVNESFQSKLIHSSQDMVVV